MLPHTCSHWQAAQGCRCMHVLVHLSPTWVGALSHCQAHTSAGTASQVSNAQGCSKALCRADNSRYWQLPPLPPPLLLLLSCLQSAAPSPRPASCGTPGSTAVPIRSSPALSKSNSIAAATATFAAAAASSASLACAALLLCGIATRIRVPGRLLLLPPLCTLNIAWPVIAKLAGQHALLSLWQLSTLSCSKEGLLLRNVYTPARKSAQHF